MKSSAAPYVAVAAAACAWGSWSLLLRRAEAIGPMSAAVESTIVMAVMTAFSGVVALRDRVPGRAPPRARGWVVLLGFTDPLNLLLFFAAYKITIAVAVLSHYLTPVFVALASPMVLRERLTRRTSLAVATSFGGLALMLAPTHDFDVDGEGMIWRSAAFGAGSAVFYAANVVVNKFVVASFSTSETMFWHGLVATPFLAAFVPVSAWAAVDPRAAGFLALVALGPGASAGLLFVWGLRRIPAAHASTLTLLEPCVAVFIGAVVFGESLGLHSLAGAALILAGAATVMTRPAAIAQTLRTP